MPKDMRVSVTLHLSPKEAARLDTVAARAGLTRHELVRARVFDQEIEDRPMLACLAQVMALRHRLDTITALNSDLRAEIMAVVRDLMVLARAESAK